MTVDQEVRGPEIPEPPAPSPPVAPIPAHVALDPLAALASGDLTDELAQLPPEARTGILDPERLLGLYDASGAAPHTVVAYKQRWRKFIDWCSTNGLGAFPAHPDVLRLHLLDLAIGRKAMSTIEVSHFAIVMAHRAAGLPSPASDRLRETVTALRRALAERGWGGPIRLDTLRAIVGACAGDILAVRDRAMLLATYWARLRRSETAGLNCPIERQGDHFLLRLGPDDVRLLAPHPEADLCPVRALEAWIGQRGRCVRAPLTASSGPLFVGVHRGHKGNKRELNLGKRIQGFELDRTLKRRLVKAGIDPASFSPNDLRPYVEPRKNRGRRRRGTHG